jgi:hypothetical protein
MSMTGTASRSASRASHSTLLEIITRAGFVGYGLLHLAIAWLALQIGLGHATGQADQAGAFQLLQQQPAGRVLLIAIAVGLIAMALWQLLLAAVGHQQETGRGRTTQRLISGFRTVVYAYLAWTAIRVISGSSTSSSGSQQKATAGMLANPAGRWLVGLAGLVVLGIGIGLVIYGARRTFRKNLNTAQMTPAMRQGVTRLGEIGYIAKGIAFTIVGILLLDAAIADTATRSRGLDGALHTLAQQQYGGPLLDIVAIGLAAFGVYCFFQAKYRKV